MGTQDRNDLEHTGEDDMDSAEKIEAIYAKWERRIEERGEKKGMKQGLEMGMEEGLNRGLAKGLEMGMEEGLRTALVNFYQARFGALPAALQRVIETTHDAPTLRLWVALFSTATADEIAAALLPKDPLRGESRRANKTGNAGQDARHAPARKRSSRSARRRARRRMRSRRRSMSAGAGAPAGTTHGRTVRGAGAPRDYSRG